MLQPIWMRTVSVVLGAIACWGNGDAMSPQHTVCTENLVHRPAKEPRDLARQGQAGVGLSGFDGIDGLSRDPEAMRELSL